MRSGSFFSGLKEISTSKRVVLLVFRIVLGLTLCYKGIAFIQDDALLKHIMANSKRLSGFSIPYFAIPWVHFIGGFFITIGVFTRLMILSQIPLVISAILIIANMESAEQHAGELSLAIGMLLLLLVYFLFGDGFYSWVKLLNKERERH
jgi:uncharacterized membrane protein YphA (DoxX/SURF4 family)